MGSGEREDQFAMPRSFQRKSCRKHPCARRFYIIKQPNVMVEWLTLLLRIREVPGSNLGPADWLSRLRFFMVFVSPFR
jgi:hypothetical protein